MKHRHIFTYVLLIFLLIVFIGLGYLTFIYFMTSIAKNITTYNLLLVAVVAGIATFFNPCSFPFLPAYLTKYYDLKEESRENRVLMYGIAGALGLVSFSILLGLIIAIFGAGFGKSLALAGPDPNSLVRWLRGIIGVVLIGLGFNHLTGRGINFHKLVPRITLQKMKSPAAHMYWYGFLYSLIGIGCGGPILAGLSIFAFSTGGFSAAFIAFIVYALVMAFLMILISALVGFSKGVLIEKLKTNTVIVKKVSGVIVIIVGLFLLLSSLFIETFTGLLFP